MTLTVRTMTKRVNPLDISVSQDSDGSKLYTFYESTQPQMTNQYSITPPFELVEQWADMLSHHSDYAVFTLATQWGADAELEACLEWISKQDWTWTKAHLRAARRPEPPSLKELALESVKRFELGQDELSDLAVIRRAIEALPND